MFYMQAISLLAASACASHYCSIFDIVLLRQLCSTTQHKWASSCTPHLSSPAPLCRQGHRPC